MRHLNKKGKLLNISFSHKKLLLSNMSNSLIKYEFIRTTLLKAKFLKVFLEPLISVSKKFFNFNIRFVFSKLRNINSVLKLFKIISPRYFYRNGGYLQIFKNGFRKGDNSSLSLVKFV